MEARAKLLSDLVRERGHQADQAEEVGRRRGERLCLYAEVDCEGGVPASLPPGTRVEYLTRDEVIGRQRDKGSEGVRWFAAQMAKVESEPDAYGGGGVVVGIGFGEKDLLSYVVARRKV